MRQRAYVRGPDNGKGWAVETELDAELEQDGDVTVVTKVYAVHGISLVRVDQPIGSCPIPHGAGE